LKRKIIVLTALFAAVVIMAPGGNLFAQSAKDSLRFPISDRRSDRFTTGNKNPLIYQILPSLNRILSTILQPTNIISEKKLAILYIANQLL